MHSIKQVIALAAIASSLSSSATASVLLPRNPTQSPTCSGCGIGLSQSDYQKLIDQLDTSIQFQYDIPWDSKSANLAGVNTNSDGTPAIEVMFEDKDGEGVSDGGTISGAQLASSLNDLNKKVTDLQPSCISLDGTYLYGFGGGGNCAGEGGP